MKNAEAVLSVKFNTRLDAEELLRICNENLQSFRNVPGLIQKYYLAEELTGAISGFYKFSTVNAREAFWTSELAKDIVPRYGVIADTIRVERYQMAIVLNAAN